jgi:hypothetical protein
LARKFVQLLSPTGLNRPRPDDANTRLRSRRRVLTPDFDLNQSTFSTRPDVPISISRMARADTSVQFLCIARNR